MNILKLDFLLSPSSFCEVCRLQSKNLLHCTICKLTIHASCYGTTWDHYQPWVCDRCQAYPKRPKSITCRYCKGQKGALRFVDLDWRHIVCMRWLPSVRWDSRTNKLEEIAPSTERKCMYCNTESRFLLRCRDSRCKKSFHPMCAYMNGSFPKTSQEHLVACDEHFQGDEALQGLREQIINIYSGNRIEYKYKALGDTLQVDFSGELPSKRDRNEDLFEIFYPENEHRESVRQFKMNIAALTGISLTGTVKELQEALEEYLHSHSIIEIRAYKLKDPRLSNVFGKQELTPSELEDIIVEHSKTVN